MKLNLKRPLLFLDIESTGLNVASDRIVEISMVKVMPDGTRQVKTRRVNPTIPISKEAQAVHGISDDDVKDEPTFAQLAKSMYTWMDGCDIAGYNSIHFDIPMLTAIPGCTVYSPANYAELKLCLGRALYEDTGLVAVRYPRVTNPHRYALPGCWLQFG